MSNRWGVGSSRAPLTFQMHPLTALYNRHSGPAAILGGGPSLPADLERLPPDALLIAVNQHALAFCRPDIVVYMDKLSDAPQLAVALEHYNGLRVSQIKTQSDVDMTDVSYFDSGMTSTFAAWFADYMGCNPILLCGMDCYQGEKKYCTDYINPHPCVNWPLENHLRPWKSAKLHLPHPERIRAVSGPLTELFGAYVSP